MFVRDEAGDPVGEAGRGSYRVRMVGGCDGVQASGGTVGEGRSEGV